MSTIPHFLRAERGKEWQQFLLFLGIFLVSGTVGSLLPTPGSWSDRGSEWVPGAVIAASMGCLFIATFRIYRKPGLVFKLQAVLLWFLCGAVFLAAAYSVSESFTFLREAGRAQGVG